MVVKAAADVGKLKCAFHHSAGSVAIVAENTRGQTAVIGADSHGPVQAFALLHQWAENLKTCSMSCMSPQSGVRVVI